MTLISSYPNPPEMFQHILSFISPLEFKNIAPVCQLFNEHIKFFLWKKICQETFGNENTLRMCAILTENNWRSTYLKLVKHVFENFTAFTNPSSSLLPIKLAEDVLFITRAVNKKGLVLQYAHEKLKKDREIVLAAIKQNGLALQYAHEDLKKDREIVLAAIKQHEGAFYFAQDDLKKDKEFFLVVVKQNGLALYFAQDEISLSFLRS